VEAEGDIEVGKGVGKATIKAGGNVLLKTGINGNSEGVIECGGDLYAKYIESSSVTCRGHVFVEEAIMHSRLLVWKHCVFNGKRSEFIAGTLIGGGSFWCKKLGSIYEAPTHVSLGVDPGFLSSYLNAKSDLAEKQEKLNKTDGQLDQLERAIRGGNSDSRIAQAAQHARGLSTELAKEIEGLRREASALRRQLRASKESMLVAEDIIYKGVVVSFGTFEYRAPDNGARKTILRPGEKELIESGFNFREKPSISFDDPEEEQP
jgi:uncharacterized protein (DUF342 family)